MAGKKKTAKPQPEPAGRPADSTVLLNLRGSARYGAFMDVLAARHGTASRAALVELALARLAAEAGITPPRRAAPVGTNRYGQPGGSPRKNPE